MIGACKKCGHWKIWGPYYRGSHDGCGTGRLLYACERCGYSWTTPTNDERSAEPARAERKAGPPKENP